MSVRLQLLGPDEEKDTIYTQMAILTLFFLENGCLTNKHDSY